VRWWAVSVEAEEIPQFRYLFEIHGVSRGRHFLHGREAGHSASALAFSDGAQHRRRSGPERTVTVATCAR
jgi:hypothetical protein